MPRRALTGRPAAGRIALCLALALGLKPPLAALAAAPDPNAHGLALLRAGDPRAAGVAWLAAGEEQSRSESNPGVLRQAALSAVLGTIAFERAKDGRAYAAWSQAIRWWLEAGTSWEVERAVLGRRVREIEASLRGAEVTAGNPVPAAGELQLLALAAATGFLDYPGPRPGLPPAQERAGPSIPVQGDYFARPLEVGGTEGAPETTAPSPPPSPSPGPSRLLLPRPLRLLPPARSL
jgi:hypothetical protein